MVMDLEKQVSNLRSMRWLFLSLGLILVCMSPGPVIFYLIFDGPEWIIRYSERPAFYLIAIAGGISIGYSIKGFRGDPIRELIIKAIRDIERDS